MNTTPRTTPGRQYESAPMIHRRTGRSLSAVERAIARSGVRPVMRFGTVNVFDQAGVAAIEAELERAARRQRRQAELATVH